MDEEFLADISILRVMALCTGQYVPFSNLLTASHAVMAHRRTLSRLRLCFWIVLVVVAVDIASSASQHDAMLATSNSTTALPNTATPTESVAATASSECWSFSNRSLYKRCINETFPQLFNDVFVFTNDNKALLCSNPFCNAALREFARNVRADCTIVT
jgi:hypothetical protein